MLANQADRTALAAVVPVHTMVHRVHVLTPASAPVVALPIATKSTILTGPILALACVIITAVTIAVSVALALIPIYVSGPNASLRCTEYYVTLYYNGSLGNDGQLDDNARTQFSQAIAQQNNLPTNRILIDNATVIKTSDGIQRIYISFHLAPVICALRNLQTQTFTASITFTYAGQKFTADFIFTISSNVVSVPPIQPNTTQATTTVPRTSTTTTTTTTTATRTATVSQPATITIATTPTATASETAFATTIATTPTATTSETTVATTTATTTVFVTTVLIG